MKKQQNFIKKKQKSIQKMMKLFITWEIFIKTKETMKKQLNFI